jgi:hypothetical protein
MGEQNPVFCGPGLTHCTTTVSVPGVVANPDATTITWIAGLKTQSDNQPDKH